MKKENKKKEELDIIEQDGVILTRTIKERMQRNQRKIVKKFYILSKTSTLLDSILTTPRNLLQPDRLLLGEAAEDKKCQKIFNKDLQGDLEGHTKDDFIPIMYDIMSKLECNENSVIYCISAIQQEKENFAKAIQENNVFKMAKSIWVLRTFTTALLYIVGSTSSFFNETELDEMYKFIAGASKTYAFLVKEIEKLMYEE